MFILLYIDTIWKIISRHSAGVGMIRVPAPFGSGIFFKFMISVKQPCRYIIFTALSTLHYKIQNSTWQTYFHTLIQAVTTKIDYPEEQEEVLTPATTCHTPTSTKHSSLTHLSDTVLEAVIGETRTAWPQITPSGKSRRKQAIGARIADIIKKVLIKIKPIKIWRNLLI